MDFDNDKKTFLAKTDRSKKGSIDEKALSIIELINGLANYYTTSSCSGRVYLWCAGEKKNEAEWLKVSHDLVIESFLDLKDRGNITENIIWLRFEPFILHVACSDLETADKLLDLVRVIYKKSSLLSFNKKIILEVRDSGSVEMPLYKKGELIFSGELSWLVELMNEKLEKNWKKMNKLKKNLLLLS